MAGQQVSNSDFALIAMTEFNWMTYLPSNRICSAFADALSANKYILQVFGSSIVSYRRDDFTSRELPALSIYEPTDGTRSRFFPLNGTIIFDIYLPIKITRQDTERVFNTIGQAIALTIQQPIFFYRVGQNLIPTPDPSSPIYNDVIKYKLKHGSPLVNFAQEYEITQPIKANISGDTNIGDVWKQQIKFTYQTDLSNFYAMLEDFGINFDYDPNAVVYPYLDDFAVSVTPEHYVAPTPTTLNDVI